MILVNAVVLVAFPPLLWSIAARVDGVHALAAAGIVQGVGIAAAAITTDPLLSTSVWSAGEAMLIALIPAVIAGIAPHAAAGHYVPPSPRCKAPPPPSRRSAGHS